MFAIGISIIDGAASGDLERVEKCLIAGDDIEVRDDGGRTPLIAAVGYGRGGKSVLAIAHQLLKAGARINVTDKFGRSAMYFAASNGDAEMVRLFRSKGARITDEISLLGFVSCWPRHMDASRNDPDCFRQIFNWILEESPPLDVVDDEGRTALHIACAENITDLALKLIELGADVNIQDAHGRCALTLASNRFNLEVVEALLKAGADVHISGADYGCTGLLWACSGKGSLEIVKALIGYGANVNHGDKEGYTALMHASIIPKLEIIEQLLKAGADVNQQDKQGRTALAHAAYWREHEIVISLLLQHHANPSIADYSGRLPLDVANEKGHRGAVDILSKAVVPTQQLKLGWSPLAQSIFDNDLAAFNKALINKKEINAAELDGRNALQLAVYYHRKSMVAALLLASADINAKYEDTASPLHIAVERRYGDLVEMLLKSGAAMNNQDHHGETPLYRAVASSNAVVVELLLQHQADPNIAGEYQKTPLMVAAGLGLHDIVEQLIAAGADVNQKDRYKRTALFAVANSSIGSASVSQALIQADADVNAVADVLGEISVLQQASINGHAEMVKLLIKTGVDVDWSDADDFKEGYQSGQTALYKAISKGHEKVVQLLLDTGANISIATPKSETLLHLGVKKTDIAIVSLLISKGIEINARDEEGNIRT